MTRKSGAGVLPWLKSVGAERAFGARGIEIDSLPVEPVRASNRVVGGHVPYHNLLGLVTHYSPAGGLSRALFQELQDDRLALGTPPRRGQADPGSRRDLVRDLRGLGRGAKERT